MTYKQWNRRRPDTRIRWQAGIWCLLGLQPAAWAAEWSGWINGQTRYYGQTGEQVEEQTYPSAGVQLDMIHALGERDQLSASLFVRGDNVDSERNGGDIRELLWLREEDAYQLRAGVGQVGWGVNELFKIADLINQKDRTELPFNRKLGQPLASLSFYWGEDLIELYTLYGLRPAWFPGEDGRLRYPLMVENDEEEYDWGATGRWDFAARWKTRLLDMDIAVSHFYGMTRDPYFIFNYDFNDPYLIPVYEKVNQTSLEWQYLFRDILLRAEFTYQTGSLEQFESVAGGIEYTFGALFGSDIDLTWIVEGIWDSRDHIYGTLFDRDVGLAARLALNDERDSNLIVAVIADTRYKEWFGTLFWSNTIGDAWSLNVTGQYFHANDDRYSADDIIPFFEQLVAENPASEASVEQLLALVGEVTISERQFERIEQFIRDVQQPDYWQGIDTDTAPQTLFDLLRISDNSQKMNLIERDSYVQFDIHYHF